MNIIDSIGEFVGLYAGSAGQEQLIWIFGNHNDTKVPLNIEPGTRLSLRAIKNTAITEGQLCCVFFGS